MAHLGLFNVESCGCPNNSTVGTLLGKLLNRLVVLTDSFSLGYIHVSLLNNILETYWQHVYIVHV